MRNQLIREFDNSFIAMVNAESEVEYYYEFGRFNAFLSMLFLGNMISMDEYCKLINVKTTFYFSTVRNEVVFK